MTQQTLLQKSEESLLVTKNFNSFKLYDANHENLQQILRKFFCQREVTTAKPEKNKALQAILNHASFFHSGKTELGNDSCHVLRNSAVMSFSASYNDIFIYQKVMGQSLSLGYSTSNPPPFSPDLFLGDDILGKDADAPQITLLLHQKIKKIQQGGGTILHRPLLQQIHSKFSERAFPVPKPSNFDNLITIFEQGAFICKVIIKCFSQVQKILLFDYKLNQIVTFWSRQNITIFIYASALC